MGMKDYGDHDEKGDGKKVSVFDEFDCPLCNANNPYGDGFKAGEEIRCYYCGTSYMVRVDDNNKLKLKEM